MQGLSGVTITTILVVVTCSFCAHGFQTPTQRSIVDPVRRTMTEFQTLTDLQMKDKDEEEERMSFSSRRTLLQNLALVATSASASSMMAFPNVALAEEVVENAVEMKTFVDPQGMFALTLPKRFFALRRTSKGDLPDSKTGAGRRGSSIFTGGDMAKAEVVAVERFPVAVLLEDEGIPATGDLSTFPGLSSNPKIVADLITLHRDKERQQQMSKTKVIPESVVLAADGKTINFSLTNEIDVQKPELLMEQMGVDRLIRLTYCKASLNSNDGNVMAIFASALEQDMNGADGPALRQTIDSFVVTDQTPK